MQEMLRTFNCGIGMVVIVEPSNTKTTLAALESYGEKAWEIGKIIEDKKQKIHVR